MASLRSLQAWPYETLLSNGTLVSMVQGGLNKCSLEGPDLENSLYMVDSRELVRAFKQRTDRIKSSASRMVNLIIECKIESQEDGWLKIKVGRMFGRSLLSNSFSL